MRIAIVHSYYNTSSPSGENITVDAQSSALRDRGHTVKLISKHTDIETATRGYPVRAALAASGISGPSPAALLRSFEPDIVHIHNLFPNWGTRWIAKWQGPIVATLHNYRSLCANSLLWRDGHDCTDCLDKGSQSAIRHKCYRDSALASAPLAFATRGSGRHSHLINGPQVLIALNSQAASAFRDYAKKSTVRVLPNFASKSSLPECTDPAGWLYVGRITKEKGLNQLLQNWPTEQPIEIIGTGPALGEIEQTIKRRNLSKVRIVGHKDPKYVIDALHKSKGLIIPSLWSEGIPTVALESLSAGTPLLVSQRCAAYAELTANHAGLTYEPANSTPSSISDLLSKITTQGRSMRVAAKSLYQDRYSENSWIESIEQIYRESIEIFDKESAT